MPNAVVPVIKPRNKGSRCGGTVRGRHGTKDYRNKRKTGEVKAKRRDKVENASTDDSS